MNAFLGISLGTPYYSNDRIMGYASWAKINADKFSILVGDEIYKYTLMALKDMSEDDARTRALSIGDDTITNITKILSGIDVTIFRWADLVGDTYNMIKSTCYKEKEINPIFSNAVRLQAWKNLGVRLEIVGACKNNRCKHSVCANLDDYMINEIAGLVVMSEYRNYPLEIYPGSDLDVISQIYSGDFPHVENALPRERKRRFMTLRLNDDE